MSISGNENQDGQPHAGNQILAAGKTMELPFHYVADMVQIYCDGGPCKLLYSAAATTAFKLLLPSGTWVPFYGRVKTIWIENDTGGPITVYWNASQTRIPRDKFDDLDGEGITVHTGITITP